MYSIFRIKLLQLPQIHKALNHILIAPSQPLQFNLFIFSLPDSPLLPSANCVCHAY